MDFDPGLLIIIIILTALWLALGGGDLRDEGDALDSPGGRDVDSKKRPGLLLSIVRRLISRATASKG